jgi:hypothetical protein
LPQLDLVNSAIGDCLQVYSTGKLFFQRVKLKWNIFWNKISFFCFLFFFLRKFHLSGGDPVLPAPIGLLSLSHVHPNVPDRRHVLDLVLDPAGSRTCQGHAGSHFIAHAAHTARQFAESSAARLLHQGNPSIHPSIRPSRY